MTELYIDNQQAVLPKNVSITIIQENPFYTKNGVHTLGLELSLMESRNAKIYGHINRKNTVSESKKERSAILIVDNQVVINGTARYRGKANNRVKLQLISGNSELNFLIGGDRRLRDLDLGSAIPFTASPESGLHPQDDFATQVWHSLKDRYPVRNWHLLPYFAGEDSHNNRIHGNRFTIQTSNSLEGIGFNPDNVQPGEPGFKDWRAYYLPSFSGQVPQPYLCFIIKEVLSSLGYSLTSNALTDHDLFKEAYIVHGFQTLQFAKMLPSWTVNEFFSNIEKEFDCTFVIDQHKNTARLLFNSQKNLSDKSTTLVVHDSYTTDTDDENKLDVRSANIAYSLDNSDLYYAYMNIERRITDRSGDLQMIIPYQMLEQMRAYVEDESDPDRFKKIFTNGYDQFVAFRTGEKNGDKEVVIPRRANSFAPLYNNPDSTEIDIEFNIIPASMVFSQEFGHVRYYFQFPVAGDYDPLYVDGSLGAGFEGDFDDTFDIQQLVEGDMSLPDDTTYSSMRLAIYGGIQKMDPITPTDRNGWYPACYVESLAEYYEETNIFRYFGPGGKDPFRLMNMYREIYSLASKIDTTETYNMTFQNIHMFDITSKFIVDNKAFTCVKIERTVTIDGFDDTVEGEFYPIND